MSLQLQFVQRSKSVTTIVFIVTLSGSNILTTKTDDRKHDRARGDRPTRSTTAAGITKSTTPAGSTTTSVGACVKRLQLLDGSGAAAGSGGGCAAAAAAAAGRAG